MRTKRVFIVTIAFALTTISAACIVEDPEATGEQEALAIAETTPPGPPRPPYHDFPPHRDPNGPTYPAPYSPCIDCHRAIPKPKPQPRIPTSCLRCHSDPHNGNYPPLPGRRFPPGEDYDIPQFCKDCHTRDPNDPYWPEPGSPTEAETEADTTFRAE